MMQEKVMLKQYWVVWFALRGGLVFGLVLAFTVAGCSSEPEAMDLTADPVTQSLLAAGSQALEQLNFHEALALADSAERRAPNVPDTYFLRGRIYSEMVQWADAEAQYKKAIELKPDYRGVWNNLGNNAIRQGEYRRAISRFFKELEYNPAPIPWHGIGRAYQELGVVDSAEFAFKKSIEVDSTFAASYLNLALLLENDGKFQEALEYVQHGLRVSPDNTELQYEAGSLLLRSGEHEPAVLYLGEVVQKWPWHHGARYSFGQALVGMGRNEEAEIVLKQAEELRANQAKIESMETLVRARPNDPFAHAGLGTWLRRAGRYNDAMHAYKVAYNLDPKNLEFQNNIANLYLLKGDTTATIAWYQNILQQDPEFVDVWLNLGVVYAISGQTMEARKAWERVLKLKPDHPAATEYLARLPRG